MTINKKFLADSVSDNFELNKEQSKRVVDLVFDSIADNLALGQEIDINGFGKFVTVDREARQGRNPKTGEAMQIAASKAVKFKPSKTLKDRIGSED